MGWAELFEVLKYRDSNFVDGLLQNQSWALKFCVLVCLVSNTIYDTYMCLLNNLDRDDCHTCSGNRLFCENRAIAEGKQISLTTAWIDSKAQLMYLKIKIYQSRKGWKREENPDWWCISPLNLKSLTASIIFSLSVLLC